MHIKKSKLRALAGAGLMSVSTASTLAVQVVENTAHAATTNQTAENYDLTKQATTAPFPVMFDRPSGVNAAALSGAIRSLGTNSDLYKSAVAAVPELADGAKMNKLLADALGGDAQASATARATIVKLINWYNSLGGTKITTQAGAAYTTANLDQPISTIAVGFAKDKSPQASKLVQDKFGAVKTTGDVMNALDSYVPGVSAGFKSAFNAYKAKVEAPNANISALSEYNEVKPVLDAYENMYAKAAAEIRKTILTQTGSTEAAVAFFESAVITGRLDASDGGNSNQNTPDTKKVKTRWVDENGNPLAQEVEGNDYQGRRDFPGYELQEERTEGGVRTYRYVKKQTPKPIKKITTWIDESGKKLQPDKDGEFPDNDGKSDIPGYTLIETKTEKDSEGNVKVINKYKKIENKPDTYWFDEDGNQLKDRVVGQELPDNDGVSDVPGYKLIKTYKITQHDLDTTFKGSTFKVGDVLNIYAKEKPKPGGNEDPDKPQTKPENKVVTRWVDETGKQLKDPVDGSHPDNDGVTDVPGYKLLRTITDSKGNVTNVYKKGPVTRWVDEQGKNLQDPKEGEFPDNDGKSDIPGYKLVKTDVDKDGNVTNTYKKGPVTKWVDTEGKQLQEPKDGEFPDNDGKSDIPGYKLVKTDVDKDGNVTNTYKKAPMTKWVDEEGKNLQDPKEGEFPDNDGKSDIPGYKLVKTDVDKDGNVTNIYKKAPLTKWIDEEGKNLQDPKEGEFPDNDGKSDIPGYKLVKTDVDKDGNVINIYKKAPITKWVDKDGKNLQEPKEGEFPDNDGKSDIKGYKLVKTDVDKDGNVTNIYEKEAAEVITHWTDTEGVRLVDDEIGKEFGGEKKIDGYTLKDVRTSKDGKQKYYIYEKAKAPGKKLPETGDLAGASAGAFGAGLLGLGAMFARRRKDWEV